MGKSFSDEMGFHSNLILQLGESTTIDNAARSSPFGGEVSFVAHTDSSGTALEVEHLGIYGAGVTTDSGETGKLSIMGISGRGGLALNRKRWDCTTAIRAQVLYRAIERKKGFTQVEPGRYQPDFALYTGQIRLVLKEYTEDGQHEMEVSSGALELVHEGGGLGWLQSINMPLVGSSMWIAKAFPSDAAPPCMVDCQAVRRQLKMKPVFVSEGPDPGQRARRLWSSQFSNAKRIWSRCCIDLIEQEEFIVVDSVLKNSANPIAIQRSFEDPAPDVIEIFLVDGELPNGGGTTFSGGSSLAKIVITERSSGNPHLLAHEVGHVLGGLHPGNRPSPPSWLADSDTVLEPSGLPNKPNPGTNTLRNCRRANNAALVTTREIGCLQTP